MNSNLDQLPQMPSLSEELIQQISQETIQYTKINGLVMNQRFGEDDYRLVHVPHVLIPTLFSRTTFEHLKKITPLFSTLVDRLSRDTSYLLDQLKNVLEVDLFTRELASIYKIVYVDEKDELAQNLAMGIHRSDYMIHGETEALQVELNTISSAFGALSQLTQKMHHYIVKRFALESMYHGGELEPNHSLEEISLLMKEAHDAFIQQRKQWIDSSANGKDVSIFFIIQPMERNFADQKHIEFTIFEKYGIKVHRVSLADIMQRSRLDENKNLVYLTPDGKKEVISVAYFRSGYTPTDYPSEVEWNARLLVERSSAIKCPTIGYQLVGTKYMQYILTRPGVLERYITEEEASQLRSVFTGIYSMHNEEVVKKAIENPHDFVGKPQREGGGNLLFGIHLAEILKEMPKEVKEGYILMERITPKGQDNIFCRGETCTTMQGVSELGTYCLFVGDSSRNIVANRYGGYLLRTKPKHMEDGGVASGVASMDSIVLI